MARRECAYKAAIGSGFESDLLEMLRQCSKPIDENGSRLRIPRTGGKGDYRQSKAEPTQSLISFPHSVIISR